jgi:hypothetical protein
MLTGASKLWQHANQLRNQCVTTKAKTRKINKHYYLQLFLLYSGLPAYERLNYAMHGAPSTPNVLITHTKYDGETVTSRDDIQYVTEGQGKVITCICCVCISLFSSCQLSVVGEDTTLILLDACLILDSHVAQ